MATLILTVDAHEDMPEGRVSAQTTLRSLEAIPRLQAICDRLGVRPTYFCDWPVATRAARTALPGLLADGRCEIGALLHPWVTPPFDVHENRLAAVAPHRLNSAALGAKCAALTEALTNAFGRVPRAFRAGGFGFNGACLQVIERQGYTLDSSVTPFHDATPGGGADHRCAPDVPYFPDRQFVDRRGGSRVLEVPLGIGYDRAIPEALERTLAGLAPEGRAARALGQVAGVQRIWLAPATASNEGMCRLAERLVAADRPLLHVYLRAVDLFAGAAPASRTEAAAEQNLEKTERFLAYALHTLGAVPRALSEFAGIYADGR